MIEFLDTVMNTATDWTIAMFPLSVLILAPLSSWIVLKLYDGARGNFERVNTRLWLVGTAVLFVPQSVAVWFAKGIAL
jgi:hypothetical protein